MKAVKSISPAVDGTVRVEPSPLGGVVIATSRSTGCENTRWGAEVDAHSHVSEAEATRSLLEIDDEYAFHTGGANLASGFRHYSRSDPEAQDRKYSFTRRNNENVAGPTAMPSPEHQAEPQAALADSTVGHVAALNAAEDDMGWRVDFEEEEARARLEKAMRDQKRLRHEELYELQKVYSKALRKNFRSLRGMPEPSFDTPSALYEEELEAIEEHRLSAVGNDEGVDSTPKLCPPPASQTHPLQSPRSLESLGMPHVARHSSAQDGKCGHDHAACDCNHMISHHADCADEVSIMTLSSDAIQRALRPLEAFALGEGTHIHTTHGGGTSGDGGVLLGPSSFVSRLRRRTTDDLPRADERREFGGLSDVPPWEEE